MTENLDSQDLYPQGEDARSQVSRRRGRGTRWRIGFLAATCASVVILTILLINILNQSMGLSAEQTDIPEQQLVTNYNKNQVANGPSVVEASENDQALADGIAADPNGIGFFGHAFYKQNEDDLRLVAVDGVLPSVETVQNGEYSGDRPLLLYTSSEILRNNPQVAAFILYYLQIAEEVTQEIGYFPAEPIAFEEQRQSILAALGLETMPDIDPSRYTGDIAITGSSTVNPVTREVALRFRRDGFPGGIRIESTGTGAGFSTFCAGEDFHIVNASRLASQFEFENCRSADRELIDYLVGSDALVVAANAANDFATDMSREELETLFAYSEQWSEVRTDWPAEPVNKYVPSEDSGTADFFVENFFVTETLDQMPYDALVATLATNVSAGRCRALEAEQRFYADKLVCGDTEETYQARCDGDTPPAGCTAEPRTAENVESIIQVDVVNPRVLQSWFLIDSVLNREEIVAETATEYPNAELKFKRWWTADFVTSAQSSQPELAGVRTAILGSLWVVGIAIIFGFPLGVGAAIYLEEYADRTKRINQLIQTNINNLAGVPSIIYGLLGLAVFVRALEPITSGCAFGLADCTTANGRTVLSAGLTLGLLILPVIIISAQEAVRAVPSSLRQASLGLGATKWQTIWHHVLPNAIGGILTGVILSMSRAVGETAPLVVVGASTFITTDPSSPFSKFTTLPSQIYQWTARPQATFLNIAAAAIIVLLILLFMLNATAIYLRNRYSKKLAG